MKKQLVSLLVCLVSGLLVSAQGLENIIVEKYYVSDVNDQAADVDGGVLPVGSVTYRIYVDMIPGYKFQAAYGVPGHGMTIQTSTLFFNNQDRGNTSPTFTKTQAANNTVMLDSWLSVGAACNGNFGVLKSEDNGVNTAINSYTPQVLQNNDPQAGIPLNQQDGFLAVAGVTPEAVTAVGITNEILVFADQNDGTNGPIFYTDNGSWASLNGSEGPTADTKVLIAQITTDGTFSFELNIQIGTPSGGTENYVAMNPIGSEIQFPGLIYNSSSTGMSEVQAEALRISVYPNPSNGKYRVLHHEASNDQALTYEVKNVSGETLLNNTVSAVAGEEIVDISSLPSGVYFLVWKEAEAVSVSKLIKY